MSSRRNDSESRPAADDPAAAELKVGWLQRSATGLWVVNSIGSVERGGRRYLVAVLSDGNTDYR